MTKWGATPDGLISVLVTNTGPGTVLTARAIITAKDSYGNVVAAASAPKGTRCCTIVNLTPQGSFGLYVDVGSRVARVKDVTVQYSEVKTTMRKLSAPVTALRHAVLTRHAHSADVAVEIQMSGAAGPYLTAQALVDGPRGRLIGVISGAFYCLKANTKRTIRLQLFHTVPAGSTVDRVVAYPLDKKTALAEKAKSCTATG